MDKQLCKFKIIVLILCIALFQFCNIDADAASSKINKTKATIYVGKTLKLKVSNAKKVKWSSTKKSVATVNSKGKVTAKKAGKCTIKAKVGKKVYKCKLTVKKPYLNNTSAEMSIDDNLKLKLTGATAKSWKSSNPDSVYVSSKGIVIALGEGSAIVTCTDTKRRKYECVITVLPDEDEEDDADTEDDTADDNSDTGFDDIGVHEHSYSKKIIKEPTCVEKGSYKLECSCGDFTTHALEHTGHDYIDTVVEPTCTEVGYTTHVCDYCGDTYKDSEVERIDHNYISTIVGPKCTEVGYTLHVCNYCGDNYKDTEVESLGHDLVESVVSAATCIEDEKLHYDCSRCDYSFNTVHVNTALGHDYQSCVFDDTTLAVPATCTSVAQYYYHCTRCSSVDTTQKSGHGKYDMNNHNYSVNKMTPRHLAATPTCTEPGKYYYHCIRCDNVDKSRTFSYGEANGHDYALSRQLSGPDTLVNKATCVTLASYYYKCYNCGLIDKTRTYSEGGYADHDYGHNVTDEALESEATCTHRAVYYDSCNICGKVHKYSVFGYGEALGHIVTKNILVQATYSTQGLLETYCGRCLGERKTSPIPYTLNIKNVRTISGATTPFTLSLDNNIWATCVVGDYRTYKVQDAMGVEYFVKLRCAMFLDQNHVYLSVYDDKMCALAEDVFFNCTNSRWVVRHHFNDKSDFIMVHVYELGNLLRSLGYNANRIILQPNSKFYEVT